MKYVYVLTSIEEDYYCEQCIVSMTSLLKHNPTAEITLLVDNQTYKTLKGFREEPVKMASAVVVKNFPETVTQKVRSRLLKTMMRKLVKGSFLFIDLDTVITDVLDEKQFCDAHVAMVLDKHVEISEQYMYMFKCMYMNAKKMGYSVGYDNKHFNTGVIYVNDTEEVYQFFDLWNELYLETVKHGIDIDQTSLNEANMRMKGIISELDGTWNVLVNSGLKYLSEAKVIHYAGFQPLNKQNKYFNTLPFELCNAQYFSDMKSEGKMTKEVMDIIEHPKRAFKTVYIIPEDCVAYKLLLSNHMRILKFLYVKFNWLYRGMEKVYECIFRRLFNRV